MYYDRCTRALGECCTMVAMDRAAQRGHLEIVKFLNENRRDALTTKAIEGAATSMLTRICACTDPKTSWQTP